MGNLFETNVTKRAVLWKGKNLWKSKEPSCLVNGCENPTVGGPRKSMCSKHKKDYGIPTKTNLLAKAQAEKKKLEAQARRKNRQETK